MSWTTGTQAELLACNTAVGSSFASFTSAQFVGPASGAAYLPANFALPGNGIGKTLLVKAYGTISTTGTPNYTFAISANTTQGTYNSSGILATTAAITQGSGESSVPWELDCLITITATGASGTWLSEGMVKIFPTGTSVIAARVANSTPGTALTLSTESAYYVEAAGTFSASSASNAVQVNKWAVLGLN